MRQDLRASSREAERQQPPAKPLVSYASGFTKVVFMSGATGRTIRFLKDLTAELRESGFPEATLHVFSHHQLPKFFHTTLYLRLGSEKRIYIEQYDDKKDIDDDRLEVEDNKTNSLWPVHIHGYRLGLLTAGALASGNPLFAAVMAGALVAIPVSRIAFGSSRIAALKDFVDATFSLRAPFCKTRHAILEAVAGHLIEAANRQDQSHAPIVLEPARNTWALREIASILKKAGMEVRIDRPQKQTAPQLPEPESIDDVVKAFDDVEKRVKLRNADKLRARFEAAAQSIAGFAACVQEPEVQQATLAFHKALTAGQVALIETGNRPALRAEQVVQTLASYLSPNTTDTERQEYRGGLAEALKAATENMTEEIEQHTALAKASLREGIDKLRRDFI